MIALGFVLALVLYVVIALAATIWVPRYLFEGPRARTIAATVVLLTFILIPTWDIIPGRVYFDHLCGSEGGVKIRKSVEDVEGFYYFPGAEFRQEALQQYGYSFVEVGTPGSLSRYTIANNNVVRKKVENITSMFGIEHKTEPLSWHITKYSEQIVRLDGKELLATKVQFEYEGNWIQRKVAPLLGGGNICPPLPPSSPAVREFYVGTLKPNKQGR